MLQVGPAVYHVLTTTKFEFIYNKCIKLKRIPKHIFYFIYAESWVVLNKNYAFSYIELPIYANPLDWAKVCHFITYTSDDLEMKMRFLFPFAWNLKNYWMLSRQNGAKSSLFPSVLCCKKNSEPNSKQAVSKFETLGRQLAWSQFHTAGRPAISALTIVLVGHITCRITVVTPSQ